MAVWDLKKYLDRVYRRNPQNNSYIVDIRINSYRDLFNDLDQDFIAYLDESSTDIPLKYPLDLEIHCSFSEELREREERIRMGVYAYYQSLLLNVYRRIFRTVRRSLLYFLVGGLFLFVSLYLLRRMEEGYASRIFVEGTNIGGWGLYLGGPGRPGVHPEQAEQGKKANNPSAGRENPFPLRGQGGEP